jgi:PAS domain S-box-containing protein
MGRKPTHEELEQRVKELEKEAKKHRQAEEALKESEAQIRLTVENAPLGIGTAHLDGRFRSMNQAYCDMLGYSFDELLNMNFDDITHPDDREKSHKVFKDLLEGKGARLEFEKRYIHKDGSVIDVIQRGGVVHDLSGNPLFIIAISEDVTEKRKLEAQFQQAQRMEAMGTLAGGIAHDFNNLLMGIQGNASLVLLDVDSGHPDYQRLKNIEQGVQSGTELTKQLLGFARGGEYELRPTNLNELIENQNRLFGRTKKEITIRGKYEENLWTVEVDQGQIGQVLLNLYVNAWQAMPGGGDLYIQTENTTLDEHYVKPFGLEPGRYVKISITDTGVGMDKATQQRIFDPFFTTKNMGRGTGLGLASVYGIIKNHGGIINVYSVKGEARLASEFRNSETRLSARDGGQGTTFNIYLPASEKEVIREEKLPEDILKGKETVLLVDDEDMIIDVGSQILEELGYKVLTAKSGKEAIEIVSKARNLSPAPDIVILDMIMPEMGGGEAYDRMKEINPNIKVLLSTGYNINGQATEILERGCDGFIQKPFSMRELSQKVREIMDKK